jgi:hypothetical protein
MLLIFSGKKMKKQFEKQGKLVLCLIENEKYAIKLSNDFVK